MRLLLRKFQPDIDVKKPFDCGIIDLNIWNRFSRVIPNPKRRSSYTSLKIGRLTVDISMRHAGLGTKIIHYIENLYLIDRKAGCRFITVDALSSATPFYQKCKFKTFVPASGSEDTTLMYIDLKDLSPDHPHIHK